MDCTFVGRDGQREDSRNLSEESLARVTDAGLSVNDIDTAEMENIREAVQGVYGATPKKSARK